MWGLGFRVGLGLIEFGGAGRADDEDKPGPPKPKKKKKKIPEW